ncbi:hypothetical protein BUE93_21405 [Chromobacterium amazonense]|uniref:Uncharacterized protein n=1 Tax=Chromobacterium amazonense TaxID=1382803 RepID=A0A2S9WYR0_9NEIS|nr:hypothetical protein [Chromobacterium amazonense]PRP68601.1 hypothetical protein BUE93_21405 [Chromobacterium amazonense]
MATPFVSVSSNAKELRRKLTMVQRDQLPFATAQALTAVAKIVQAGEAQQIGKKFKNPTPFTRNSVGMRGARKSNQEAMVFIKDRAARYLAPYEEGGVHALNGKALLNPKDIKKNAYGQLSRGTLARLKARPDVFIGKVRFKDGREINGVWQRPPTGERQRGRNGTKGNTWNKVDGKRTGGLKLLIRFGDALPVDIHLGYHDLAGRLVFRNFNREMGRALAKALATTR